MLHGMPQYGGKPFRRCFILPKFFEVATFSFYIVVLFIGPLQRDIEGNVRFIKMMKSSVISTTGENMLMVDF